MASRHWGVLFLLFAPLYCCQSAQKLNPFFLGWATYRLTLGFLCLAKLCLSQGLCCCWDFLRFTVPLSTSRGGVHGILVLQKDLKRLLDALWSQQSVSWPNFGHSLTVGCFCGSSWDAQTRCPWMWFLACHDSRWTRCGHWPRSGELRYRFGLVGSSNDYWHQCWLWLSHQGSLRSCGWFIQSISWCSSSTYVWCWETSSRDER